MKEIRIDFHACQAWFCLDNAKPARIGSKWDVWLMIGNCGNGPTFFAIPGDERSTPLAARLNDEHERGECINAFSMFKSVTTTFPVL